jgi:hypothetical protein
MGSEAHCLKKRKRRLSLFSDIKKNNNMTQIIIYKKKLKYFSKQCEKKKEITDDE